MKANVFKTVFKISALAICLICVSCNDNSYKESVVAETVDISQDYESARAEETITNFAVKQNDVPVDLKIIKSASARYKVGNVKEATQKIKIIAQKHGAYISDLRFQNDLYKKENRFTLKVPQRHFDKIMDSVYNIVDFVEYENITTKDVTEEYIDIETRLKTKLEIKKRYEDILRKKAKTVEDILKTEDRIGIIQEEIEAAQGRLKYLTNKVAFSTIQIDLYETVDYTEEPKSYTKTFLDKTKEGLSNGWSIIETLIIILINIWPLLIISILIFIIFKNRKKK